MFRKLFRFSVPWVNKAPHRQLNVLVGRERNHDDTESTFLNRKCMHKDVNSPSDTLYIKLGTAPGTTPGFENHRAATPVSAF